VRASRVASQTKTPFPVSRGIGKLECVVKAKARNWPCLGGNLPCIRGRGTIDRSGAFFTAKDSSKSASARTRKTVNYACVGRSQRKLWWRLVEILTCKSFFERGYRGERLIEPSSSWFPPKFPSG
jgi:hypothetical protein